MITNTRHNDIDDITKSKKGYKSKRMLQHHIGAATFSIRKRQELLIIFDIGISVKQIKQNFPLKYFYGESANAIKIQIWVTLIANLLHSLLQSSLERNWSFSGLATMVRLSSCTTSTWKLSSTNLTQTIRACWHGHQKRLQK